MTAPAALPRRHFIGRFVAFVAGTALFGRAQRARAATQGTEPYLGEIGIIACDYPPKGWAFCNGQLLSIVQNQALFAVLGTTYGGNGVTTFALPDLRDRVPIHHGQGPGLASRSLGEKVGELTHTLASNELASHAHGVRVSSAAAVAVVPTGLYPARNPAQIPQYGSTSDVGMASTAVGNFGGGQAHENQQPGLGLNFIIALIGVFPQP